MKRFINKNWYRLGFITILLVAVGLRFYQLGSIPQGMTWDEAAIGYNGFAVWNTRRDEWLKRLPTSFQSFGDYKAPLAIYINGASTAAFGMNLWAVRLPFALSGVMAVAGMIVLVRYLLELDSQTTQKNSGWWRQPKLGALVAGGIMALSPWHIHFSRTGFETGMALSMMIWGVYLFLRYFLFSKSKSKKINLKNSFLTLVGIGLLVSSMYTYHSAKIVVPFLGLSLVLWHKKTIVRHLKLASLLALVGVGLLSPMIRDTLFSSGAERLSQTTIFNGQSSGLQVIKLMVGNYLVHLKPDFLLDGATTTLRHGSGRWGVLLITTLVLVVSSLKVFFRKKINTLFTLGLVWLVVGLLPAAIGQEVPHANRALLALPGFLMLAVVGFNELLTVVSNLSLSKKNRGSHGEKQLLIKTVAGLLVMTHLLIFVGYNRDYYARFAAESASDFKDGYLEAFAYAIDFEKGINGRPEVEKIIFSDEYGQPYIYALFARQTNPIWYQGGSLIKYEFKDVEVGDLLRPNTLVVASGNDDDLNVGRADKLILGSDRSVRFKIYLTK